MKDYIEVKVVEAEPMSRGEYNAYRGWKIPSDENPADELNAPPKMVYRSTENITSEAFAHMFEAQFDKVRYDEMKKYFPQSLEYFEKKLKEAAK